MVLASCWLACPGLSLAPRNPSLPLGWSTTASLSFPKVDEMTQYGAKAASSGQAQAPRREAVGGVLALSHDPVTSELRGDKLEPKAA